MRGIQRSLLITGILAGAVLISIGLVAMRGEPPKKESGNLAMLVDVIELEPMTARFPIRSQGTVRPRTETVLSAEISGSITEISPKFIAGGVFRAGEVLMRIDPTNYEVAVRQAEALLNQRQIEYEGAQKLRNQGYRAESEFASAAAALATAEADLVRAKRNLDRTFIRLPYDGIVRAKEADIGQFVNPGTRSWSCLTRQRSRTPAKHEAPKRRFRRSSGVLRASGRQGSCAPKESSTRAAGSPTP